MVGAVGETASMKRRKLWKTGEDGLCCSSSAIQTRLDPSSLLEERSETPIVFVCFFCVVGYPPNWGKRPRYIDRPKTKFSKFEKLISTLLFPNTKDIVVVVVLSHSSLWHAPFPELARKGENPIQKTYFGVFVSNA